MYIYIIYIIIVFALMYDYHLKIFKNFSKFYYCVAATLVDLLTTCFNEISNCLK